MKCAAVVLVASVVAAASGQETEIGKCQNIAFAPKFQSGTGPITPCEVDDTCSTACCSGNLCRNPLALSGGATCGNGFAPSFSGFPCESLEEALQQRNFLKPPSAAPDNEFPDAISFTVPSCQNTQFAPANGPGERFTTSECQFDAQCSSNCCDGKRCRVPVALTSGEEFCRVGFTPVFSGTPCANEEEAIGEVLESRDVDEPVENEEDELAYEVPDCANAQYQPNETGPLLYTAECTEDNQCSTACCELNAKICVEISGLTQGEQFCTNGFTPVYEGTPCAAEVDAIGDPIVNDEDEGSNLGLILGVGAVAVVAVGFVLFRKGKEPQQEPPSAVTSSNPYARSY